jgi:hypothetical protein
VTDVTATSDAGAPTTPRGRRAAAAVAPFVLFAIAVAVLLGPSLVGVRVALPHDIHLEHLPWRVTEDAEPARNPELRDTIDYFYPAQRELLLALREGRDATWLRGIGWGHQGVEFLGWGALSPFNAPALVLPFDLAWSWAQGLRLYAAMVGAYLLARRMAIGRGGATVTGLSYGMSGFLIAWLGWPQSHVAAAIPWALWGVRVVTTPNRPPWWGVPALALATATLWLGGFPAVTLYSLIAAGIVAAGSLLAVRPRGLRAVVARAAGAAGGVTIGTLLVAFTLLPTIAWLDVLDLGARTRALGVRIYPPYLWKLLFPGVYGDVVNHSRWIGDAYVEMIGYAGVVTLLLGVCAWALRPRRRGLGLFTGMGLGFGLLAFGFPPLVWVAGRIPGLATNAPSRTVVLLGLCIAVCGGFGADAVIRWVAGATRPDLRAVSAIVLLVVGLIIFVAAMGYVGELRDTAAERLDPEGFAAARRVALTAALRAAGLVLAAATAVAAMVWVQRRGGSRADRAPHALAAVLCLVVGLDMVTFAHGWNIQAPREGLFPDGPGMSELAAYSEDHRTAGADGAGHANVNLVYGIADLRAHAFLTARQREVLRGMEAAFSSPTRWELRSEESAQWEPWLSASAVAAVLVPADAGPPPPGWSVEDLGPVGLWRNPHAREIVTAVPRGELVQDGAMAELDATAPAALDRIVRVEPPEPVTLPEGRTAEVLGWETAGSRTTARVTSDGGAVVVVADAAVPGWQATISGEPAPVVTADHLFLGVVVPPGEHVVELRYRAPGAAPGRVLSLVGLILLLLAGAVGRRHPAVGRHYPAVSRHYPAVSRQNRTRLPVDSTSTSSQTSKRDSM